MLTWKRALRHVANGTAAAAGVLVLIAGAGALTTLGALVAPAVGWWALAAALAYLLATGLDWWALRLERWREPIRVWHAPRGDAEAERAGAAPLPGAAAQPGHANETWVNTGGEGV